MAEQYDNMQGTPVDNDSHPAKSLGSPSQYLGSLGTGMKAVVPSDWPDADGQAEISPMRGGMDRRIVDKRNRNIGDTPYSKWPK